jgi:FAD:protein FMN transferase
LTYTVDLVANLCEELGVTGGVVNLGGDVRVLGPHPNGNPWQIGIQHPRRAKEAIAYVDIHEGAIATSGDYERFMMIDGQRYSHLLDPHTGLSIAPAFASVSVIAPQCLVAGSFSTIALLKSVREPEWIHNSGLSYLSCSPTLQLRGSILTAPKQTSN